MSKKERNNILRIGLAARKQRQRLLISSLEEIPGELIEHVVEEWAALNDLLECSSGVYYRPRKRKVYTFDDSNLKKWQCLGFTSLRHYLNYNAMNNTVAGARDFDELFNIGDSYTE